MKRVFICSRLKPDQKHSLKHNLSRAALACNTANKKGYAPIAPHLMYSQFLDDNVPAERKAGMEAGLALLPVCDEVWQWGATVSEGMAGELALAQKLGIPVRVFNSIGIPKECWKREEEECNTTAKSFCPSAPIAAV